MPNLDDTLLQRYLDHDLDPEERARTDALLAADPAARQRLEDYEALVRATASALDARLARIPAGALWDRLESELDAGAAPARSWLDRLMAAFRVPRLELGLACGALAAAAAIVVWVRLSAVPAGPAQVAKASETAAEEIQKNALIVESYEVTEGTVVIDVSEDMPGAPAVVWHFVDDDTQDPHHRG